MSDSFGFSVSDAKILAHKLVQNKKLFIIKVDEGGKLRPYYSMYPEEDEKIATDIALRKLTRNLNLVREAIVSYESKIRDLDTQIRVLLKQGKKPEAKDLLVKKKYFGNKLKIMNQQETMMGQSIDEIEMKK